MLDALPTSGPRRRMIHSLQAYEALGLSKMLDEEVFLLPRWIEGPVLDVNVPLLSRRGRIASLAKMFAVKALPHVTISSTISSTFHRRRWNIVDIVDDEPATRNDNVNDADVK